MADKKSKKPEQPDPDKLLEQKVDAMMDIKGGKNPPPDDASAVSDVAASVNESLAKNMTADKEASEELDDSTTAPELPGPQETPEAEEPVIEEKTQLPTEADSETEPESEPESNGEPVPIPDSDIDDSYTEKAVDDIVAEESDKLLAVEDAKTKRENNVVVSKVGWMEKLRGLFAHKRFWAIILIVGLVLFAVPYTRYKVVGLFIKKSVTITVVDSKTTSPVSNADVVLAGTSAKTDANGKAQISAGLGKRDMTVTKRYYQTLTTTYFVGLKSTNTQVKLVATGRLVPVSVVNNITGKPVSGAQIQSEGTTAKTNAKGIAEIALPTKAATYNGTILLKGYNSSKVLIQVTDKVVKTNAFAITPSGQVYFLSNANGTLDVVKTNLDGSGRKTVLAGTGKEDARSTSLLASRDWRFLALKSHRDGPNASLYLIDTSNDKLTQFDTGDADFSLVGWYDHNFVYSLTRNNLTSAQTGKQALKSYDADHLQLNQLDQTQAEGTAGSSQYQNFANFYLLDDQVVYSTQWNREGGSSGPTDGGGKNDTIRGVQPNGQNKKDYQSFPTANNNYIQATPYEPQAIYFAVYDNNSKPTFYQFANKAVKPANIDQATFDKTYPTFLISPSGKQTLWTELLDGKNTLFTGDANAGNKKQIVGLTDFSPYGWFADSYTLISKNNSQLYIIPTTGLTGDRQPLKITDYYKPAQTYAGYGYGYGGL